MKQTLLVIEHCERGLSDWLTLEYRHAAHLWPAHTLFTNVTAKTTQKQLQTFAQTTPNKANLYLQGRHCLILDPTATTPLAPKDFISLDAIIIGGILGYKNPRGRTKTRISDHSTIDGAALVAKAIALGMKLADIEIAYEVEITHDPVHSTILPFGYPIIDGTPIITPGLIEYLTRDNETTKT